MKRGLVLLGSIFALVCLADGLAMVLTPSTQTVGGTALMLAGGGWFYVALPRLVRTEARPFLGVLVPKFGAVALPSLVLPVAGLWWVATPAALTVWFFVAWASLWCGCLLASAALACPDCAQTFGRSGLRLKPVSGACAHCGVRPIVGGAQ